MNIIGNNLEKEINNIIHLMNKSPGSEYDATKICYNLWLGNMNVAYDDIFFNKYKVSHIIDVTPEKIDHYRNISCTKIPIYDRDAHKFEKEIFNYMINGAKIIHDKINNGQVVLVHCKRGHHRSASIVILYLMKYHQMSLLEAIKIIKQKRPTAIRRISCMVKLLIKYEITRKSKKEIILSFV